MPKWTPKFLVMKDGRLKLRSAEAAHVDKRSVEIYEEMLARAGTSRCCQPIFSGFHVRGASANGLAGEKTQEVKTGNIEYGYCQALHNEEAAVASMVSKRKVTQFAGSTVVAIVAGKGKGALKNFTAPCGNCRDILRDVIGNQCLIVSGAEGGGKAIVMRLDQALFDTYWRDEEPTSSLEAKGIFRIVEEGDWIRKNPYFAGNSLRDYFVGIASRAGFFSFGAARVGADFHPIYPIERAIIAAEVQHGIVDPEVILVVANGDGTKPPDVMYRDRQSLLEVVVDNELLSGKSRKLPIRLHTVQHNVVTGTWQTDADEWLPFPFSARNFGKAFLDQRRVELKKKYGHK